MNYRSLRDEASPGQSYKISLLAFFFLFSPQQTFGSPPLSLVSEMHSLVLRRASTLAAKPITSVSPQRRPPPPSSNSSNSTCPHFDVADFRALLRHCKAR